MIASCQNGKSHIKVSSMTFKNVNSNRSLIIDFPNKNSNDNINGTNILLIQTTEFMNSQLDRLPSSHILTINLSNFKLIGESATRVSLGQIRRQMDRYVDKWIDWHMNRYTHTFFDTEGHSDYTESSYRQMDRQIHTDRWTDIRGQTNGQTQEQIHTYLFWHWRA